MARIVAGVGGGQSRHRRFVADRVRQALQQQAQSLIGADLRITSTRAFSPGYCEMAQVHGLRVVESRTFPSMVSHREQVLLSENQCRKSRGKSMA